MHSVTWSLEATSDLETIAEYIAQFSPTSAESLVETIQLAVAQLPLFPYLYKNGRVLNTREMVVHPNYIVVYSVGADSIRVVSIVHSRQNYPTV